MRPFGNPMTGRPTRWRSSTYQRCVTVRRKSDSNGPHTSSNLIESFSKISSGIQSLAVVIGLMIGAWWALHTYIFQNPAYYERGGEVAGREPDVIRVDLSLVALDPVVRQYQVTLTVHNASKNLSQALNPALIELAFFKPNEKETYTAQFTSRLSPDPGTSVPPGESRDFRYLAEFPSDGSYILETDICKQWRQNCLSQIMTHISTKRVDTASQSMTAP
ncbi:hypothetical protein LJR034_009108 [Caballeronia sp. LjRoot34]|uniref:hypothetical protein n=1 Tax=Caballeronia sp. LjRoot34 TaxID=3342325 RepID=UPI003ECD695A